MTAKADKTQRANMGERGGFHVTAAHSYLFDATTELRMRLE
jgi:hypothetical protein